MQSLYIFCLDYIVESKYNKHQENTVPQTTLSPGPTVNIIFNLQRQPLLVGVMLDFEVAVCLFEVMLQT